MPQQSPTSQCVLVCRMVCFLSHGGMVLGCCGAFAVGCRPTLALVFSIGTPFAKSGRLVTYVLQSRARQVYYASSMLSLWPRLQIYSSRTLLPYFNFWQVYANCCAAVLHLSLCCAPMTATFCCSRLWHWHAAPGSLVMHAGDIPHADIPLQHQRSRQHLRGHPQGLVEPGADYKHRAAADMLVAAGPQPM